MFALGDRSWETSADWDVASLIRAADDHGVSALVWQALAGSSGRIAEIREVLAPTVRAAATRDIFIQRDMQTVLASVAAAGVRALVIKGSALAYTGVLIAVAPPTHRYGPVCALRGRARDLAGTGTLRVLP